MGSTTLHGDAWDNFRLNNPYLGPANSSKVSHLELLSSQTSGPHLGVGSGMERGQLGMP